ncbi:ATP-binding protein [Paracraurococcus ruber]|uniref:ATP-binding protein n=1 Tax=Paracraurococcus ruber TaxID=77675 RepID=UPI0013053428|nr:winged helix-turn-helix domain-containing protein [Paracraurococcus ruber]
MPASDGLLGFGPFRLDRQRRLLLLADGRPVELGSRALDILLLLLERPGALVGKAELMARVWPGLTVEDGNLRVQMAGLRKALAEATPDRADGRYVETVPGLGYRFVAPVQVMPDPASPGPAPAAPPAARLFGREAALAQVLAGLRQARLVTLVGPGGIGKTTLAGSLAIRDPPLGLPVRVVDLSPLSDPVLVPGAIAAVLGVATRGGDGAAGLVALLRDRSLLLVLDGCEHLLATVAALAEALLRGAPGLRILATSQEPLEAEGEMVLRLPPLALPPDQPHLGAREAMASPAVQLFVARAAARLGGYALTDAEAPVVAAICRRLDGIALAIEMAAGRVDSFGVDGVNRLLDDRFRLLVGGRRTALPRHQALRATLGWSFDLLAEEDRDILSGLAVFAGPFTLGAAEAVLASDGVEGWRVAEAIGTLVAKSLVSADLRQAPVQYRLLETTRAFALEQLRARPAMAALARRHAEHYRDRMLEAEAAWERTEARTWLALYGRDIDNVRAAHDWAFSPGGDRSIGLALTAAAAVLWFQLALLEEGRARFETALREMDAAGCGDPAVDIRVLAALAASLTYTIGPGPEVDRVCDRALELADSAGAGGWRMRALWASWVTRLADGRFAASLDMALAFQSLAGAAGDAANIITGHRLAGVARTYLGRLDGAAAALDAALAPPARGSHVVRVPFNQQLTARSFRSQVLWLQGFPEQALDMARRAVAEAEALDQPLSLSLTLAEAGCPIPQLAGDLALLDRHVALMARTAADYPFGPWAAWAACFEGGLLAARGETAAGIARLRTGLDLLRQTRWQIRRTPFLADLGAALLAAGETAEARATLAEALARARRDEEAWCLPELLRRQAALDLAEARRGEAEAGLREALAVAEAQGALSWTLRAATDLAGLLPAAAGHAVLAPVLARFTEGFGLPDLQAAAARLRMAAAGGSRAARDEGASPIDPPREAERQGDPGA